MVHQECKERKKNPTHKKYEHLAPSVPKKKGVFLKFYMFIFLNIQFLNVVFTEPAMHYKGCIPSAL